MPTPAGSFSRWFKIGTGVGIEIRGNDLAISVVRMRPSGPQLAASHVIENYHERPASECCQRSFKI